MFGIDYHSIVYHRLRNKVKKCFSPKNVNHNAALAIVKNDGNALSFLTTHRCGIVFFLLGEKATLEREFYYLNAPEYVISASTVNRWRLTDWFFGLILHGSKTLAASRLTGEFHLKITTCLFGCA